MILTLIESITSSGATYVTFDDNIDSTYDEYLIVMANMDPSSENELKIDFKDDAFPLDYVTNGAYEIRHNEANSIATAAYYDALEQSQNAPPFNIVRNQQNDSDCCVSGLVHLYSPASTTFMKMWTAEMIFQDTSACANRTVHGGYINQTTAVTGVRFSITGGNITGIAQLYGVA